MSGHSSKIWLKRVPRPRAAKRGSKGHKNVYWDRFIPFGCHFSAFRAETGNRFFFPILRPFWAILGPFWALLGPFWGLGSPQRHGGTGQERPKGGQKAIEMCFGTVLDHLDAILVHFEPKLKIDFFFDFETIWALFGPFFGPLNSAKSFWGPPLPQYKKNKKQKKTSYFERSRGCF